MNTTHKTIFILLSTLLMSISSVSAARLYIDAPQTASSNREQFSLSIIADPENDTVSGIAGDFSFPEELFVVKDITTQNGVISFWAVEPHVSNSKSFDQRVHISFEGIIPGGFKGVSNPYYSGKYPGIIFTVTLIPKGRGEGALTLSNVELHAYDSEGTVLSNKGYKKLVTVPELTGSDSIPKELPVFVGNTTVTMTVSTSDLINNSSPYLYIHDENPSRAIDHILIAETSNYYPPNIDDASWRVVTNPYPVFYSSRTKYIHAKIMYSNNTYTLKTLPPVENSQALSLLSRILIGILLLAVLLHYYGKNILYFFGHIKAKHT